VTDVTKYVMHSPWITLCSKNRTVSDKNYFYTIDKETTCKEYCTRR